MNPYQQLSADAFWRTAVADKRPRQISTVWQPKFPIDPAQPIATAGSCFAQHISQALQARGYAWLDGEPAPAGLAAELLAAYNYGVFSFRTGNIYTVALLKQWLQWAERGDASDEAWLGQGRCYDPFRPNIEPEGFSCVAEMRAARRDTVRALAEVLTKAEVFIFTLGLTEAWLNVEHGWVYPMCPGTVAGQFDADRHRFVNYHYRQIDDDLREVYALLQRFNPAIKLLLTVSPVPLTATASGRHVLVATTYSKSVLRAVAGALAEEFDAIDYFPSYELIASFPMRARFYQDNLRSVKQEGVDLVMQHFFAALGGEACVPEKTAAAPDASVFDPEDDDVVCEEQLLNAFGPKPAAR